MGISIYVVPFGIKGRSHLCEMREEWARTAPYYNSARTGRICPNFGVVRGVWSRVEPNARRLLVGIARILVGIARILVGKTRTFFIPGLSGKVLNMFKTFARN